MRNSNEPTVPPAISGYGSVAKVIEVTTVARVEMPDGIAVELRGMPEAAIGDTFPIEVKPHAKWHSWWSIVFRGREIWNARGAAPDAWPKARYY